MLWEEPSYFTSTLLSLYAERFVLPLGLKVYVAPLSGLPAESRGAEPSLNSLAFQAASSFSKAEERSTLRPPHWESVFRPRETRVMSGQTRRAIVGGLVSVKTAASRRLRS